MPRHEFNGYEHYWEDLGAGRPLVMIHGASASSRQLLPHVTGLKDERRLLLPDLRGMGRSERVSVLPKSAWIEDLAALVDHLELEQIDLYGMSLGSRVALRFAVDHPHRVMHLMLDFPILYNEPAVQDAVNTRFDVESLSEERRQELRQMHGEDWEVVVSNYQRIRNQEDLREHLDLRERSKNVAARTLLMRGDAKGGAYPLDHAINLHSNIKDSWLWVRPNTGAAVLPRASDEATDVIRQFLGEA